MRIISGKYKGRLIQPPPGLPVRPTLDRAKEGLFNILIHRFQVEDARVLELFAGTGNMMYEFLSRGAGKVTAVDAHAGCVKFMEQMLGTLRDTNGVAVKMDAFRFLENTRETFDIIFMDPPYQLDLQDKLIRTCFEKKLLAEDGIVILEHLTNITWDHFPWWTETRTYGGSSFSFFQWQTQDEEE